MCFECDRYHIHFDEKYWVRAPYEDDDVEKSWWPTQETGGMKDIDSFMFGLQIAIERGEIELAGED